MTFLGLGGKYTKEQVRRQTFKNNFLKRHNQSYPFPQQHHLHKEKASVLCQFASCVILQYFSPSLSYLFSFREGVTCITVDCIDYNKAQERIFMQSLYNGISRQCLTLWHKEVTL